MKPAAGVPLRPLVVFTLVVLALHALALRMAPGTVTPAVHSAPWEVRTIEPARQAGAVPAGLAQRHAPASALPAAAPPLRAAPVTPRPEALPGASPQEAAPATTAAGAVAAEGTATAAAVAGPDGVAMPRVAVPGPARWRYAVTARHRGQVVTGEAQLAWRHDGRSYEAVLEVNAPPLPPRIQRSTGELGPEGLAPSRFSERLRGEQAAHFDRERGRIVFSSNRPEAALQPGAQDRLGVLLQLAALVAGDSARFAPGTAVVLQTATAREAGDWSFSVEGMEQLALPAGPVAALKLIRPPRHEYDVRIEVWLVPGPDYGPARLRLTAPNGDWLDLQGSGTDKG